MHSFLESPGEIYFSVISSFWRLLAFHGWWPTFKLVKWPKSSLCCHLSGFLYKWSIMAAASLQPKLGLTTLSRCFCGGFSRWGSFTAAVVWQSEGRMVEGWTRGNLWTSPSTSEPWLRLKPWQSIQEHTISLRPSNSALQRVTRGSPHLTGLTDTCRKLPRGRQPWDRGSRARIIPAAVECSGLSTARWGNWQAQHLSGNVRAPSFLYLLEGFLWRKDRSAASTWVVLQWQALPCEQLSQAH